MKDIATAVEAEVHVVAPVPISCRRITILTTMITVAIISRSKLPFDEVTYLSKKSKLNHISITNDARSVSHVGHLTPSHDHTRTCPVLEPARAGVRRGH